MKKLGYFLIAVLLAACSKGGSEYIGKWENSKSSNRTVVVERNGDSFLVKETSPSMWKKGETETRSVPAVLKDGMLQVQTGFGVASISHVKETDILLMPTMGGTAEYKRAK